MHANQTGAAEKSPSKEKFTMILRQKEDKKSSPKIDSPVDRLKPHSVTPPIEPEDYSYSQPDFFMHHYAEGKRGYLAFICQRCPKIVIFH